MLHRSDLHDYQRDIIGFIQANDRCAVWAQMGSGKTVAALTALDDLSLVEDDVWPALVLAPLRVARSTWPSEVTEWAQIAHLKVSVVTGDANQRAEALMAPAHIYTCNFDNLEWLVKHFGDRWPFKTVIADEFTRLKSFRLRQGAKRARALGTVAHTRIKRFIGLTGTPSPNGLIDLWGQSWFLDEGKRLGRTFSAFEQRWFSKGYDGFSMKPMPHAQREIEDKLRDICLTVQGLTVDEPIFNNIYVELPLAARKLYGEMERDMFAEIEGVGIEAFNAAARTSKLLQLSAGAVINDSQTREVSWVHDAKLEALESVIEEASGAPVLVAYQFVEDRQRLLKKFPKAHALSADPKDIERWNNGDYPIMLVHPASAGHGLNLARGGNILAFFSLDWNLEEYMQVIERIGPMRQKQAGLDRPVFVHHILGRKTMDEDVLERLKTKRSVQDILLAALKRR